MLRELKLRHVYDSADCNLVKDLIEPLLSESVEYWRGVGFFTSGWLRTACFGILELVRNKGIARVVTSPLMSLPDWEALQIGESAKSEAALLGLLRKQVVNLGSALSSETLNALSWMVADRIIEFRFAIPRVYTCTGDYHDKVGLFIDSEGNAVAIHGSFNDSARGSLNGEAFSVFKSWDFGQLPYVEQHKARLLSLWEHGNTQFRVVTLPDAIREELIKLRTGPRPYSESGILIPGSELDSILGKSKIELRTYQQDAIDAWEASGFRGIFEMATGTGKTFTALAAAHKLMTIKKQLAIIILVPYLHLLDQWRQHCETFDLYPILCSGKHDGWSSEISSIAQDFRLGTLPCICILAVHQTASTEKFAHACAGLPSGQTLLIADEVHGLGAPKLRGGLLAMAESRLGLSATPNRWYDEEGTRIIHEYFTGVCFEYPLEKAIGEYLTPYMYIPVLTELTVEEREEYEHLSQRIASFAGRASHEDTDNQERLKMLLIKRARVVSSAENKLPLLVELLSDLNSKCTESNTELRHVLVYCAPGTHRDVLKAISHLGLRCHEFVHTVSMKDRAIVLKQFGDGDIQVLVAVHCLDEGVDVPATRLAFFLASTTNPREFIQRRGRILRKYEGKRRANVYDFVVVPPIDSANLSRESDLSVLNREMPRFAEFASSASNEFEARHAIRNILDAFQVLYLLDAKPWDIYHASKETLNLDLE